MIFGYNTNVPYKGKMYHVQTEDTGKEKGTIVTLLYHEGAILCSKKSSYADLAGVPDAEDRVREKMKQQHKVMMKALIAGKFDDMIGEIAKAAAAEPAVRSDTAKTEKLPEEHLPEPAKAPEKPQKKEIAKRVIKSLDDILLEHIARKVKD